MMAPAFYHCQKIILLRKKPYNKKLIKLFWPSCNVILLCQNWLAFYDQPTNKIGPQIVGPSYKRCRQFFWIFNTPLSYIGSFLIVSIGNFDQFLPLSPSQLPTSFMDGPKTLFQRNWYHYFGFPVAWYCCVKTDTYYFSYRWYELVSQAV